MSAFASGYSTVYEFSGSGSGFDPIAPLTADASGNLYGLAALGGAGQGGACGTVYKTTINGRFTTLYSFTGGVDGCTGYTGLTLVENSLYGNAYGYPANGSAADGRLFSVHTDGTGFTVLHQFTGPDGTGLAGELQSEKGAGLFGVSSEGGIPGPSGAGNGTLFLMRRDGTFKVLHDFAGGRGGRFPDSLLIDTTGKLFGATQLGGSCANDNGCGLVFEYAPQTGVYTVLYRFQGTTDGSSPTLGSIGADGTLYGATTGSSLAGSSGTLFSLSPASTGYTFKTLVQFINPPKNSGPTSGPTLSPSGDLFGATAVTLYSYHEGKLTALPGDGVNPADGGAQPLILGRALYDTSEGGGLQVCPTANSCGLIFSYSLSGSGAATMSH